MSWNNRGGGLAHNPPFVVPVQVDQQLEPFIPLFTGYVLDCIVSTAGNNQARAMFKELMEQDQNALGQCVQDLANVVEFYVFSENLNERQVEPATRNSVEMVVNAYLAMAVNSYPQEFGPVLTQDQIADVQNYIRALEDVKFQAQRFFQGGSQGFVGRGQGGGSWQNRGRGGGSGMGWNRGAGNAGGRVGYGNARTSRWDEPDQGGQNSQQSDRDNWPGNRASAMRGGGGGGSWNQGAGGARGTGGRASIWDDSANRRAAAPTDSSFNTTGGARVARKFEDNRRPEPAAAPVRNVQPIVPNQTVVDGQTFIPVTDQNEWPKVVNRSRIWDWILLENGTQIRPAFLSDWKVQFDKDEPFAPWYDPETHILFHYKSPEGVVSLEAIKREPTMEYLEHELDPELRRRGEEAAREREGKVAAAWQLVERLRPNPSQPLATAEPLFDEVEGEKVELINPDTYLTTSSLADAIKRSCLRLKVDRPEVLKEAFEMYVDRGVLTTIVNPDYDLLFQMTNASTYRQLFDLMMESRNAELNAEVDGRIVTCINNALQQSMGLSGWSIGNFLEDYGDLIQALREDHGDTVVQVFEEYGMQVISRALAYYGPKEMDDTIRKAVGLEDGIDALVWLERSSVTRLPVTSDDLRVPSDEGVLVSPSRFPEVFKTLDAIFGRTTDLPHTFYGRYLATADGTVYSVVKGYLNDQAIMIFKAPFNLQ